LLVVAVGKIATTSLTIGSGGSGGVFGPSMVIGGCIGAAVGTIFHMWFPILVPDVAPFAIVGMAGFFAGVAKTPISTRLMVGELTGNYTLLLPSMLVVCLAMIIAHRWTI
jgi:chloride channel protein, CIC family